MTSHTENIETLRAIEIKLLNYILWHPKSSVARAYRLGRKMAVLSLQKYLKTEMD